MGTESEDGDVGTGGDGGSAAGSSAGGLELLRALVEIGDDWFWEIDAEFRYTFVGPQVERLLGYSPEEVLGKTPFDLMPPDEARRIRGQLVGLEAPRPIDRLRNANLHRSGNVVILETSAVPIFDDEGAHRGYRGIDRDITARDAAERALAASEARLQSIFRAAPTGIGLVSQRRILDVNARVSEMTGYTREELVGQSSLMLYPSEEEFAFVGEEKYRQIALGGTGTVETQWRCKDGRIIDVLLSSTPLDLEDLDKGVTFTALDITERKELEARLRQSEKMEAVGHLAGGVAHDFNNMLQAIGGFSELALSELDDGHPAAESIEQVTRVSARAAALTRQLLAFSRAEARQPELLDLHDLVVGVGKMLRRVLGEQIEVEMRADRSECPVFVDPGHLEQVVTNLCVNARDSMPDGGRLEVETRRVSVKLARTLVNPEAREGEYALLRVADTGCGMTREIEARIFEPFFTTKEVGQGTGLGLATVYAIIQQHGGWIEVESELGKGSTFLVYFPISDENARSEAPEEVVDVVGEGHETILLAEDDEIVAGLAAEMLERFGYRVYLARDGAEALAVFRSRAGEIELAILDVVMPKCSGHEVLRQILSERPELPVLLCTGYGFPAVDDRKLPRNVVVLRKPYRSTELLAAVRRQFDIPR